MDIFDEIVTPQGYQTNNLGAAVASGNEIMINCKSYLAVPAAAANECTDILEAKIAQKR